MRFNALGKLLPLSIRSTASWPFRSVVRLTQSKRRPLNLTEIQYGLLIYIAVLLTFVWFAIMFQKR